jgi:hypothetical protein
MADRRQRNAGRGVLAGLAAVVVLSLGVPSAAFAGSASQTAALAGSGSNATVTAVCPDDQRATGGGFLATPPTPSFSSSVAIQQNRKIGQRSWRVTATKSGNDPANITAFAYCSKHAVATKARSSAPSSSGNADVGCRDLHLQAGGFFGGTFTQVTDSFRAGSDVWRTRGFGIFGGGPTSFAYCNATPTPRSRQGTVSGTTNGALLTAISSKCPGGTRTKAGGFIQRDSNFYLVYESRRASKRWRTSGMNFTFGPAARLSSVAYCS